MRRINKKKSTKGERIFYEILKELNIPFKHRWLIEGREIDFVLGKLAIEVDGHKQVSEKNNWLVSKGYVPVHLENKELINNRDNIKKEIYNLCQIHILGEE